MRALIDRIAALLSRGRRSSTTEPATTEIVPAGQVQREFPIPIVEVCAPTDEIYIPTDLEDCFAELHRMLSPEEVEKMQSGTERDMIRYHHGFGTWLRNNWGLWGGSRLAKWFNAQGVNHADDMSTIILMSFWRHLNDQPIELDGQVAFYQKWWKSIKGRKEEFEDEDTA